MDGKKGNSSREAVKRVSHIDRQNTLSQGQKLNNAVADIDADIRFHEEKLRCLKLEKERLIKQGGAFGEESENNGRDMEKLGSKHSEKQAHLLTDQEKEIERLRQQLKAEKERHKIEMERQRNIMAVEHEKVLKQNEELKKVQMEKQSRLDDLEEKQRKLEQDKEQLMQTVATLKKGRSEEMLQIKIRQIEEDMKNIRKEKEQIKDEYGQRIVGLEKETKEFVKRDELQTLLGNTQFDPNIPCVLHDEDILSKIRTLFVSTIIPMNILHIFHKYNRNVLVQQDIDVISAVNSHYGKGHGAAELLSYLVRYEGWFSTLVQVLRDPPVKQGHVADAMWDALGMGETRDKNLPMEEVKQKLKTAVTTLQMMKQYHSQDGIKCLTFICQTFNDYDSASDLRHLGDCLTDCGFVETCMKFLQDHVNSVTIQIDQRWPAIDKTLNACWGYCGYSLKFAKKVIELDGVKFFTEILRDRCYLNLDRERDSELLYAPTAVLYNVAVKAGVIAQFKDSRTVVALMSLIKCTHDIIMVKAMGTLAILVNEEEEEERKVKLIDPSHVISTLIQWITEALEDKEERKHQGFEAWTLTQCLTRMAVCDINRRKIIDGGGLPVFLKMLTHTNPDPDEQTWTAYCVELLARYENIKQEIIDYPGLVPALEELKKSHVKFVRDSVIRALRNIQYKP